MDPWAEPSSPPPSPGSRPKGAKVPVPLVVVLVVAVLIVGAGATIAVNGSHERPAPAVTAKPLGEQVPAGTGARVVGEDAAAYTSTTEPATTSTPAATTTTDEGPDDPAIATTGPLTGGPGGAWQFHAGPTWQETSMSGLTAWYVGGPVEGFADNVNVETFTGIAAGTSPTDEATHILRQYRTQYPNATFSDVTTTPTAHHGTAAVFVIQREDRATLAQKVYAFTGRSAAAVFTVTTLANRADTAFATVDPYVRSLTMLV